MFTRFYLTSKGRMLEARLHAEDELAYTKFQIGDGELPEGQSQEAMTELINPIKTLSVAKAEVSDDHAVITFNFSNLGMDTFTFREIGLFADDPVEGEILFAYANAGDGAEVIPAYSTSPISFTYGMDLNFSNVESVNITMADDLAFVVHRELPSESISVPASAWQGDAAPYTASVSCSIAKTDNALIIMPGALTAAQYEAMAKAQITCTAKNNGTITLTAYGAKPSAALPISAIAINVGSAPLISSNFPVYPGIITANLGAATGTGGVVTVTKTVPGVTADMTPCRIEYGNPSAVLGDVTITTAENSVTFSAKMYGSSTVKVKLSVNTDVSGT